MSTAKTDAQYFARLVNGSTRSLVQCETVVGALYKMRKMLFKHGQTNAAAGCFRATSQTK